MREIYDEQRRGEVWGGYVLLPTEVGSGDGGEEAMASPEKIKWHAGKVKFGEYFVYFCYFIMK